MAWSLEPAANPTVLVAHVTRELTTRTIDSFPPGEISPPLDEVLALDDVLRLDLHRYRARITARPGSDRHALAAEIAETLAPTWGPPQQAPPAAPPRAFEILYDGPRVVAESLEMAANRPLLMAAFGVPGVAEAILAPGMALITLGRLFSWDEAEAAVAKALSVP